MDLFVFQALTPENVMFNRTLRNFANFVDREEHRVYIVCLSLCVYFYNFYTDLDKIIML